MKCCAFAAFDLFVPSPSVFPSTALLLALSISQKPGEIIVPGIWKKCLQTNPGSLLSLNFVSICIHSQRGNLQCHPTGTWCIRPRDLKIACCFLQNKNSLLPRNHPGSFFHNHMLINDGILVLINVILEQTAPLYSLWIWWQCSNSPYMPHWHSTAGLQVFLCEVII